eukprot:5277146-Pyramimonas_sp.AAC.1
MGLPQRLRDVAIRERARADQGGDGAEENRRARSGNRQRRRWRVRKKQEGKEGATQGTGGGPAPGREG